MERKKVRKNTLLVVATTVAAVLTRVEQSPLFDALLKSEWRASIAERLYLLVSLVILVLMESGFLAVWLVIHKVSAAVLEMLHPDAVTQTVYNGLSWVFLLSFVLVILVANWFETKKTVKAIIGHDAGGANRDAAPEPKRD